MSFLQRLLQGSSRHQPLGGMLEHTVPQFGPRPSRHGGGSQTLLPIRE